MTDSPPRPPGRPRSEASRDALLDAAFWQVRERGYLQTTAEQIAKAAGAGKPTLYRAWPSKGALVLEAFAAKMRERIDRPREAAAAAGDIEKFLIADFAALRPFADALAGLTLDAAADVELREAMAREIWTPRTERLAGVLASRIADAATAAALAEAIEGALFRRSLTAAPLDEAFARSLARLARLQAP